MLGGKNWGKNSLLEVLKQNNPLKINELLSKVGCLTWIRTKTNCTKNSCATVTPSGNPYAILRMECKNRGQHKIFQIFMSFWGIIINLY